MSEAKTVNKVKTGKNEEVRTEPQMPQLPKLNEDLTWDHEIHSIKYRLHEATIPELAEASVAVRSEDERRIRLLSLVVQQQTADGEWGPLAWPKGGADRLYQGLWGAYGMGLVRLEIELLKCSPTLTGTSSAETSPTRDAETSVRP